MYLADVKKAEIYLRSDKRASLSMTDDKKFGQVGYFPSA
jgi:hypothetical protein